MVRRQVVKNGQWKMGSRELDGEGSGCREWVVENG